jgi:CRP/FNR family transcriptional regulator, cyclic AMP receptor protein
MLVRCNRGRREARIRPIACIAPDSNGRSDNVLRLGMGTLTKSYHEGSEITPEEKLRLLVESRLLAGCSFEQIQAVTTFASVEHFPDGAIIIKEDTPSDYCYLLVEGAVVVYREEKHFLLNTLSSGAVFGIMSLMERKPRSATVEARTPVTAIKLDLLSIRNSLPEGIDIYERIIINHMNDLEAIVRSTDSLAIEEMKMNQEELKVRVSFGKFFASLVLIITLHFAIGRLMLQYIEELGTTTFLTAGLLVAYGIFVFFLMKRMHYSWAEYGFTLANWRPCLADALVQSAIFIVLVTLLKWGLLEARIFHEPLFELPFFHRYTLLFGLLIVATYACFCFIQEMIFRGAIQNSLIHFLTGRFARTRVVLTTTLIVFAAHLHLKSLVLPLLVIVPNIFWCLLYYKYRSLLGVTVSHIIIGVWVLFIMGAPGE